ncbi:unnamed protein product [Trifolium pratense]|uniref:Uncharacterized protein n=1 Tax=Trifolium pratense TaxID=57577 RepID=A0ACB0JS39_TRIPR|nr:unnamed protein product [Trifolium pratense]
MDFIGEEEHVLSISQYHYLRDTSHFFLLSNHNCFMFLLVDDTNLKVLVFSIQVFNLRKFFFILLDFEFFFC